MSFAVQLELLQTLGRLKTLRETERTPIIVNYKRLWPTPAVQTAVLLAPPHQVNDITTKLNQIWADTQSVSLHPSSGLELETRAYTDDVKDVIDAFVSLVGWVDTSAGQHAQFLPGPTSPVQLYNDSAEALKTTPLVGLSIVNWAC